MSFLLITTEMCYLFTTVISNDHCNEFPFVKGDFFPLIRTEMCYLCTMEISPQVTPKCVLFSLRWIFYQGKALSVPWRDKDCDDDDDDDGDTNQHRYLSPIPLRWSFFYNWLRKCVPLPPWWFFYRSPPKCGLFFFTMVIFVPITKEMRFLFTSMIFFY